jgi:outer membrane receptor for monomeric catechols
MGRAGVDGEAAAGAVDGVIPASMAGEAAGVAVGDLLSAGVGVLFGTGRRIGTTLGGGMTIRQPPTSTLILTDGVINAAAATKTVAAWTAESLP